MALSADEQRDALAIIRQTLAAYGLDSPALADWAWQSLTAGNSIDQILLELEQRPEFRAAFPEIQARLDRALESGVFYEPMGPAEILAYRSQARSLMRSFGLPESYYGNPTVLFNLIVNDKSLSELNDALELTERRVTNAPPEVRAVFEDVFGADAQRAMLLAFTNDDVTITALEDMVQQAEAGGAARRLGFELSQAEMARVAGINLSYDQAVQGFTELDRQRHLLDETISETADFTAGEEGIAAVFNLEGDAGRAFERRAAARAAETGGSAGSLAEQRGVTGLGEAGRR